MSLTRIFATDTPTALAEVARRFGPDALIVSTSVREGGVEVTVAVSLDDLPPTAPKVAPAQPKLPDLPGRLVLLGPPGAGVSLLAARLAAHHMQHGDGRPVQVIAPRADVLAPASPLHAHGRLLGLDVAAPIWPASLAVPEGGVQIIDLSGLGQSATTVAADLCRGLDALCWLVLPTGLHLQAQDALIPLYAGPACALVLTRADLCPLTLEDRALPRRFGLPIAIQAAGTGIMDALSVPTQPMAISLTTDRKEIVHVAARLR